MFFVLRKIKEYERAVVLGTTLSPVSFIHTKKGSTKSIFKGHCQRTRIDLCPAIS